MQRGGSARRPARVRQSAGYVGVASVSFLVETGDPRWRVCQMPLSSSSPISTSDRRRFAPAHIPRSARSSRDRYSVVEMRIVHVLGARPNFVKMAPAISGLRRRTTDRRTGDRPCGLAVSRGCDMRSPLLPLSKCASCADHTPARKECIGFATGPPSGEPSRPPSI